MGNYFNELRRETTRANNSLQSTHQATTEPRLRKPLVQERSKSNLEPRHQTPASSTKPRKSFAKFTKQTALFKKFESTIYCECWSQQMAKCSSKTKKLRDTDPTGRRARNITIQKWEIDNFKIKVVTFIANFGRNNIIRNWQIGRKRLSSHYIISGHYQPTGKTPFQWRFAGRSIVTRFSNLTGRYLTAYSTGLFFFCSLCLLNGFICR